MLWNLDVWREMERLRREVDGMLTNYGRSRETADYPLVNAYENSDAIVVTAELPGIDGKDVSITFTDGMLLISGKREHPDRIKKMKALRQERTCGKFEKSLRIPVKVDTEGIAASFDNGVLTVTLPKAPEARPKTITIEAK